MKKNFIFFSLALLFLSNSASGKDAMHASWTVVGAGPTGIMAVGLILDSGIPAEQIAWIDPEFNVGRMGKYYKNVPGNGRAEQYIAYFNQCTLFANFKSESLNKLYKMPREHTPALEFLVNPLQDITDYLITHVVAVQDEMKGLNFVNNVWQIQTNNTQFQSDNVVLATGAHPRTLNYEGVEQIPLDIALDKEALATRINPNDTVAVIGSAHSAILVLKHLSELPVASIINFYKKPIVYPIPMRGGIAWKESGLKGSVAQWAKTVLEENTPSNIIRVTNTQENMDALLPQCTKVIYAIGFERNELPAINGDITVYEKYDRVTRIIAPGLYGLGMAFPEQQVDPLGNIENLVGLPYVKFDELEAGTKAYQQAAMQQ